MEQWLKIAPSQTKESTKNKEKTELKSSVSGVNTLQTEQCASASSGVRGASAIVGI